MMDKLSGHDQEDEQTNMPPGFRFHPTDEELITHYLSKKVVDDNFVAKAIAEVDMNKTEPWELPWMAKLGGKEWYFFCVRDKKYPTGLRTNRATASGYWKATGKDKEIFRRRLLIGMKKTLVFYMGRAPKGEKTNWVIHEYRLAGKSSMSNLPASSKNEWVISRVFYKTSGGKKVNISELIKMDSGGVATSLPPLTESPVTLGFKINNQNIPESVHVPCFSNAMESNSNIMFEVQSDPTMHQFPSGSRFPMCDQAILRGLIGEYGHGHGHGHGLKMETEVFTGSGSEDTGVNIEKGTSGIEDQEAPSTSGGPFDLDCLWNY